MLESQVKKVRIENFRNFKENELEFIDNLILICGPNGSGKTSILEAISLLSPGKGIKNAKFSEQINFNAKNWYLQFELNSYIGNISLEQNHHTESNKRSISLNSRVIPQTELSKLTTIFWLTPQKNGLFQESQSDRRRYYDRIVYAFVNDHATNLNKYEHYQTERLKILTMDYYDSKWVEVVENKLTELAIKISMARAKIKTLLQHTSDNMKSTFPKIEIHLDSKLDEIVSLSQDPAEAIKEEYIKSRAEDARIHRNHFGALKTDFSVHHSAKNTAAKFCSTGEQQACMISLLLAQTEAFITEENKTPILLLDELFVHLDNKNRSFLTEYLKDRKTQTIVTTTEKELCNEFASYANIIEL